LYRSCCIGRSILCLSETLCLVRQALGHRLPQRTCWEVVSLVASPLKMVVEAAEVVEVVEVDLPFHSELLLELLLELSLGGFGGLCSSGEGVLGCLVSRCFLFRSEECSNSASISGKWCRMPCLSRRSANCIANCCSSSALIESASVLA